VLDERHVEMLEPGIQERVAGARADDDQVVVPHTTRLDCAHMDGTVRRLSGAELTPQALYGLLRLRVEVFVVEQRCAYAELDGRDLDPGTLHLVVGPGGAPLAYLRLLAEPDGERRIGRVCTATEARGRGLSRRLLEAALQEVGDAPCVLDAQEHLTGLYGGFGFVPSGPGYDWDGVPHVPMRRPSGGPSRFSRTAPRKEDTGT
jgi:ElaA protein